MPSVQDRRRTISESGPPSRGLRPRSAVAIGALCLAVWAAGPGGAIAWAEGLDVGNDGGNQEAVAAVEPTPDSSDPADLTSDPANTAGPADPIDPSDPGDPTSLPLEPPRAPETPPVDPADQGADVVFVGTVVGQPTVDAPVVTLTDGATGEELGSAQAGATGEFTVVVSPESVTEVQALGVTVSGRAATGEQLSVESTSQSEATPVVPGRAAQDSLLVMVDPPRTGEQAPVATLVLGSESSALETAQTWTDDPSAQTRAAEHRMNRDAEILEGRPVGASRLSLTGAGASPAVIVAVGAVAVGLLAWAMMVAGRRRRH